MATANIALVNCRHFLHFCDAIVLQTQTRCQTGLNFHWMKLLWMATDPRKPQKFNPAKVKAYTVSDTGHSLKVPFLGLPDSVNSFTHF